MHKSATKCNETLGKWCKNKHGAPKIIDTFETYQSANKIIVSGASKVTQLGVFKSTYSSKTKSK
jgi:hypothetical protein